MLIALLLLGSLLPIKATPLPGRLLNEPVDYLRELKVSLILRSC